MLRFSKISFILIFFGSIFYLVYHMSMIRDDYKKEVAKLMLERRLKVEKECKYILEISKRLNCYLVSAKSLRADLKLPESRLNAKIMYQDTFKLNLDDKIVESDQYQKAYSQLEQELAVIFNLSE
jgi:hypothetical protein